MFKKLTYNISIIVLLLLAYSKVNAEGDSSTIKTQSAHIYREQFSKDKLAKKSYGFRNYKVMGRDFKALCELLHTDGRREMFIKILQVHSKIRRNDCNACKPFYKVFAKACRKSTEKKKSKRRRKGKKKEALEPKKEIKVYKQREPSLMVVNYITNLFTTLAEFDKNSRETYQAVKDLVAKLLDKKGKTPGELEYVKHIKNYFLAPFDKYLEEQENIEKAKKNKASFERRWKISE